MLFFSYPPLLISCLVLNLYPPVLDVLHPADVPQILYAPADVADIVFVECVLHCQPDPTFQEGIDKGALAAELFPVFLKVTPAIVVVLVAVTGEVKG